MNARQVSRFVEVHLRVVDLATDRSPDFTSQLANILELFLQAIAFSFGDVII